MSHLSYKKKQQRHLPASDERAQANDRCESLELRDVNARIIVPMDGEVQPQRRTGRTIASAPALAPALDAFLRDRRN